MTLFLIKKMTKNWGKKWPQKSPQKWCRKTVKIWTPENIKKWPKIKKPQKCQKTTFFTFFKETPKNGQKPPGGVGGSKKGVRGVPGGSVLGVSRRKRLENGGKPYSSQGSPKGFLGENRPKLSRGPPKFTDVSRENDHFPWKDFPISPCGKIRRQVPKKPNENPGTGGSKNVPLLEGPPTRFCWGTFFFYRPPKPPFPLEDLCRRNARKGVFRFLSFLLQPGFGKNAKKAPHQNL